MITEKDTNKCMKAFLEDQKYASKCSHLSYYPLVIDKVQGSIITDIDGNEFIDFLSSASSLNMGSTFPPVVEAMKEQIDRFSQYTPAYTYNRTTTAYAKKLASVFPGGVKAKVCFGNCGSDANDAAIKFARAYTGRPKIFVFLNGYHGSTYGSASLTTCSINMRDRMGPFLPEVYAFPYFGSDLSNAFVEENCLKDIETACSSYMSAREVAAVIIEPLQGDGGILPAHPLFIKKLHQWCKDNGVLFISEEVQQRIDNMKDATSAVNMAVEESAQGVTNVANKSSEMVTSMNEIGNEAGSSSEVSVTLSNEVHKFKLD